MVWTKDEVKNEPMVFSASYEFAYEHGGDITRLYLEMLEMNDSVDLSALVIDTRVHMLKPGWFPSIPGWHCDAIPRNEDRIVDLDHPHIPNIKHHLALVDCGTGSLTKFLVDEPEGLPKVADEGENLWGTHSKLIREALERDELTSYEVDNEFLYHFPAMKYHTSVPATGHGWRFFFRASENTLTRGPFNEIRNQVQVYLPLDIGW